jgi:hypothetical protein
MRGVWKDAKRAGDPDTAAQIQLDRELVETSRRGVAHVAGITSRLIDWKAETILRTLIASPIEPVQNGFDIFGFTPDQVAGLRRRIDQEQGKYVSR